MNKMILKVIILLLALTLTGCTSLKVDTIRNDPKVYAPSPIPVATDTIYIQEGQFEPEVIEIHAGDQVNFINLDNARHLIISDPHPEHNQLPDLYSQWLVQNDSYSYVFGASGTFGIHLEDNPSVSAKIIVLK